MCMCQWCERSVCMFLWWERDVYVCGVKEFCVCQWFERVVCVSVV